MALDLLYSRVCVMSSPGRFFLLIVFCLLPLATSLSGRAQSEELAPVNPDLRSGVLDNGLSYYVMENDKPEKTAHLRLVVKAGSLMEDDDQLGIAHFLEHMLFRGTEKYPGVEMLETLEGLGIEMGPDVNAFTTPDRTTYMLKVKMQEGDETGMGQLPRGLDILREFAFHAELKEESFEVERDVVIEEWRLSRDAGRRLYQEYIKTYLEGSRFVKYGDPIGKIEVLESVPLEVLKRFYREWYRPDLMAVIAVGDFDADQVVEEIRQSFGSYPRPSREPRYLDEGRPTPRGTRTRIVHDPEATDSAFYLSIMKDTPEKYDNRKRTISIRESLVEVIFSNVLNERFQDLIRRGQVETFQAIAYEDSFSRSQSVTNLYAELKSEKILEGIEDVMREIHRVREFGFLPSEIQRAKAGILESTRNSLDKEWTSEMISWRLDGIFSDDEVLSSEEWYSETVRNFLSSITDDEIEDLIDDYFVEENRTLVVTGPSVPALTELQEGEVLRAATNPDLAGLAPWVEEEYSSMLVSSPPQPGRILRRETIPGVDVFIERWELSNGAVVYVMPNDNDRERFIFRAVSSGGLSLVEDEDWISGNMARLVPQMGVGDFSMSQLEKSLVGKSVSLRPYVSDYSEGFEGSGHTRDIEYLFQLVYLHHRQPYSDEVAWKVLIDSQKESSKNADLDPQNRFSDLVNETLYQDHFRVRDLEYEDYAQADLDEALRIYRQRFLDPSGFSYVFVGDFDLGEVAGLVEQWIASIPAEYGNETWQDRGVRLLGTGADVSLKAGNEPLSVVLQAWTGNWEGGFSEMHNMQSLAASLKLKLTEVMREEMGGTYGVVVWVDPSIRPVREYDFGVHFSCEPEKVETLSRVVLDTIGEWRESGPSDKLVENLVNIKRQDLGENLEDNYWLIGQVFMALHFGFSPEDMNDRAELYESLSAGVIQETARRYLNDGSYMRVVLYPESYEGEAEHSE